MQAIEQSRLLNNLRRDLRSNYKADESLSLLNLSGHEFEVTDTDSNITKIVYPRTVFHTGRPKKSLLIEQKINDETVYSIEIPRSKISGSFMSVDTPMKYVDEIGNYGEFLNNRWIDKIMTRGDIFIITAARNYIIHNKEVKSNLPILVLLLLIVMAIAGIVLMLNFHEELIHSS